jgi:hypothetical protein
MDENREDPCILRNQVLAYNHRTWTLNHQIIKNKINT